MEKFGSLHQGGSEAFVTDGFNSWKKIERLKEHVGHSDGGNKENRTYTLLYRLLKLALVLPVATAIVERCFSSKKIRKSNLRNRIGEEFLNACVICAIKRETLVEVKDEDVMERFNHMRLRRGKF
ncbi:uncharacterized protein [Rutidosis leptorrhynchoides]|uniref:uncharacterized protein n=1 Tax=Rutidosis leptorrhynchoides TaxID=125765 RepID=UPI003A99B518